MSEIRLWILSHFSVKRQGSVFKIKVDTSFDAGPLDSGRGLTVFNGPRQQSLPINHRFNKKQERQRGLRFKSSLERESSCSFGD